MTEVSQEDIKFSIHVIEAIHTQGYGLIHSFQSEDQQVHHIHCEEFSMILVKVIRHYIVKVSQHIPEYETDLEKTCMLLNNLHALRVNIQDMFSMMGGEKVNDSNSY